MQLTADELRKLSEQISATLESEGKPLSKLSIQLGRLISHLESDQRVYVVLERDTNNRFDKIGNQMEIHRKELYGDESDLQKKPGLVHQWRDVQEALATNRTIHKWVLTGVGALILKSVWEMVTGHKA